MFDLRTKRNELNRVGTLAVIIRCCYVLKMFDSSQNQYKAARARCIGVNVNVYVCRYDSDNHIKQAKKKCWKYNFLN